ncbi:MAG: DedA family protein [Chloroflexi bacterium]|nr:DedA family protein [Chloroflexota bacterium]
MEQTILNWIENVFSIGWPAVVLLMAIESACIPLPSEIIMPFAGWMLIANKGLGIEYVFLIGFFGAIGNVIGSVIAYYVGVWGGRPFLNRFGKYILVSPHEIEMADRWFNKYGDKITFFSRLLPVVRTFISFPAGIARMKLSKFILYSFLGALPWSIGLAYGGYVLGQNWEKLREVIRPFDIPIITIICLCAVFYFFWRIRSLRKQNKLYREGTGHPEKPLDK